jgi:hypothetical protein
LVFEISCSFNLVLTVESCIHPKFMHLFPSFCDLRGCLSLFVFSGLFGIASVQAQVSVNGLGGNAQGIGGSSSYSIGQTFAQSQISGTASVLQGVQQAVVLTNLGATKLANNILLVYPNPTTDYLELRLTDLHHLRFWFVLYDAQGKVMCKLPIMQALTKLHLGDLPAASYTACVYDESQQELQTFKFVKLNQ